MRHRCALPLINAADTTFRCLALGSLACYGEGFHERYNVMAPLHRCPSRCTCRSQVEPQCMRDVAAVLSSFTSWACPLALDLRLCD